MDTQEIRRCNGADFESVLEVINDASRAYRGVIPPDRWKEPYMSGDELRREIADGVVFWGYEQDGELVGVMGVQEAGDVTLIRHAYVKTARRNRGVGGRLLSFLRKRISRPILIGTWSDAVWAIAFYEKHGFRVVSPEEKERLLRRYWKVPQRQIETSVVLREEEPGAGSAQQHGIQS
jgi:ribosomal protein S18 acetylase RimI-like enzyme